MFRKASELPRTLTRRYVLALVMLAVLATGALGVAQYVIYGYAGTAALVNVAGRQRMLSQRAALFADRLTSQSAEVRERARRVLLNLTSELAQQHEVLSSGKGSADLPANMKPALHRVYFGSRDSIDPLMKSFLAGTRSLADKSRDGPIAESDPQLEQVYAIGTGPLLSSLDKAVAYYEAEGEAAVERLWAFEIVAWLAGVAVLLASALLIFAPMVRRLSENLNETRSATEALARSEERFAMAAQGASVGIRDHFDLQQDEEYWSPQFYRLLGYAPGELASSRSAFYLILHPDDRQSVSEAIDHHLHAHTPLRAECRLQHKTQGYRWFLMTGQANWTDTGMARRLIMSFMDIDIGKQAEQMKSEFVSTVSHELRTPLTSIVGALGLLRSKVAGDLSEKGARLVTIAHDNCERLACLINDLLDVEKIESGKIAFDFEAESLTQLLLQAKEQNALYAEKHGATIELEPLSCDVTVEVDRARFAQVMANLLSNASKYSPPGGKITVAVRPLDGAVRISVTDQGPGVPAAFRDRIFQRFAQADASDGRRKGGTGLGLNIAKAIVEAHGGTIGFDTSEGQGTTFYFELPTAQAGTAPTPGKGEVADVVGIPTTKLERLRSARVLVVETGAVARATISDLVGDLSDVTVVSTCREAGALLARRAFDLVILDDALLEEAGSMLWQAMSEKGGPVPPILAYAAGTRPAAARHEGIAPFVQVQVDERTLRQAVLDELRRREEQLAMRFRKSA